MNTTTPISVASIRLRSTDPWRKLGTASTGSASTTAKVSRLTAVIPATVRPRSSPASTSIRY